MGCGETNGRAAAAIAARETEMSLVPLIISLAVCLVLWLMRHEGRLTTRACSCLASSGRPPDRVAPRGDREIAKTPDGKHAP